MDVTGGGMSTGGADAGTASGFGGSGVSDATSNATGGLQDGSSVAPESGFASFADIASGGSTAMPVESKSSGGLLGGFDISGALGAVFGGMIGSLAGPIGSLLGGLIGYEGGAHLGGHSTGLDSMLGGLDFSAGAGPGAPGPGIGPSDTSSLSNLLAASPSASTPTSNVAAVMSPSTTATSVGRTLGVGP